MMLFCFYATSLLAVLATVAALTRANATHALIYLVLSLLAVAVLFFILGAPFAAALEVLIYAGAIMVLFVFVVMMLNLGEAGIEREKSWLRPGSWLVPTIVTTVLLAELVYLLPSTPVLTSGASVDPKAVGMMLFGPWVIAVELVAMLLMSALVGAYHVSRRFIDRREGGV